MKKLILVLTLSLVFGLGTMSLAQATVVSFIPAFSGIDTSTGAWSTTDDAVNLGITSFNILGGAGTVTAFNGTFSQRGTRGIGVWGGLDTDEIDKGTNGQESIEINFPTLPYVLNSFELRSLFNESTGIEYADVYYYLNSIQVGHDVLVGTDLTGTNGVKSGYPNILLDKIVFKVDTGSIESEFAIASLDVTPVPEPTSMMLLGMGILGLFGFKKRKN